MKTIESYLNELKEKTGSDNKTALALKLDRSAIANIRKRNLMSDETAVKIALLLEIEPEELLLAANIARNKGSIKKFYENISRRWGVAAGFFIVFQSVIALPDKAIVAFCILC